MFVLFGGSHGYWAHCNLTIEWEDLRSLQRLQRGSDSANFWSPAQSWRFGFRASLVGLRVRILGLWAVFQNVRFHRIWILDKETVLKLVLISINWSLMFSFLQLGVPTTVPKIATNLTALCTPIPMGGMGVDEIWSKRWAIPACQLLLYIAAIPHLDHRRGGYCPLVVA